MQALVTNNNHSFPTFLFNFTFLTLVFSFIFYLQVKKISPSKIIYVKSSSCCLTNAYINDELNDVMMVYDEGNSYEWDCYEGFGGFCLKGNFSGERQEDYGDTKKRKVVRWVS